jgi:hypothetical protein
MWFGAKIVVCIKVTVKMVVFLYQGDGVAWSKHFFLTKVWIVSEYCTAKQKFGVATITTVEEDLKVFGLVS